MNRDSNHEQTGIDYSLCIFCQQRTVEPLQCPTNSKRKDTGAGFKTLSDNLTVCEEYDFFPFETDLKNLDEGNGFEDCLASHNATWHKTCILKINKTKLERLKCLMLML